MSITDQILIFIGVFVAVNASGIWGYYSGKKYGIKEGYRLARLTYLNELRERDIDENERFQQYMRLP